MWYGASVSCCYQKFAFVKSSHILSPVATCTSSWSRGTVAIEMDIETIKELNKEVKVFVNSGHSRQTISLFEGDHWTNSNNQKLQLSMVLFIVL